MIGKKELSDRVGAIVDGLDEVWTRVQDLIADMDATDQLQDASSDLDLVELRAWLGKTSNDLWRKKLPYVLAEHFTPQPDPDAQRNDAQDKAMREARGE
jgi:hypothetical protein